ncbi:MAG TPA: ABC transporter ATP-binding protein [Candidatus Dormibacteraeota bacterium]
MAGPLLQVKNLTTEFGTSAGPVRAVDGVSFEMDAGETLGIVGESGSGKSITALSILNLVPEPGKITGGQILFKNRDVVTMTSGDLLEYRGGDVAMIFQDPMTSLNPVLRIGFQIEEAMRAHSRFDKRQARERVIPLLERVRIPSPKQRARDFPHQFSGGMRQRAMIAMGLANEPSLLIADEPTTALDVTVQAQILELLKELNRELGTAIILISHNVAVISSLCTRVMVMYAGRVVESGPTRQVFDHPEHPYTWSLLRSVPRVDERRHERLISIKGMPPDLSRLPTGCTFHPRCQFKVERCLREEPPLVEVAADQEARCWVLMSNVSKESLAART